MKNNLVNVVFIFIIISLFSCGESEEKVTDEKQEEIKKKETILDSLNEQSINKLTLKYSAVSFDSFSTIRPYTYRLQEFFIDGSKLMSFKGEIRDISKSDSSYILNINNLERYRWYRSKKNKWRNYFAKIKVDFSKHGDLEKILNTENHSKHGCFIFKVSKIIPLSPAIKSDIESDGEYSDAHFYYDFNEILIIIKGELVDFYLDEIQSDTISK